MAQDASFSPEMMARLQENAQYIIPAAKAVSRFARFPGPDGRYYADYYLITCRFDTKKGCPVFTFAFIILANVENNDQKHAGFPARIQFYCIASANQTIQQAWDRLFTDGFQAMGIKTSEWQNPMQDLATSAEWLNREKFPVVLSITTGPKFQNYNIVEVLNRDAIKGLTRPQITITEDDVNRDSPELLEDADTGEDFKLKLQQVEAHLAKMTVAELIAQIHSSQVELEDVASKTDVQLKHALMRHFILSGERDPAEFGYADNSEASSIAEPSESVPFDTGAALAEALKEEDDDDDESIDSTVFTVREDATNRTSTMTRDQMKLALHQKYQISKFSKSMTDDVIRNMLIAAAEQANEVRW